MALIDLKYTKAELKEERKEMGGLGGQSPYPWGLSLSLERNELSKLGIKDLPQVGSEVHFMAVAKVTSVNTSAGEDRDEEARVGLQITMLDLLKVESAQEEKAEGKETPKSEAKEAKEAKSIMQKY